MHYVVLSRNAILPALVSLHSAPVFRYVSVASQLDDMEDQLQKTKQAQYTLQTEFASLQQVNTEYKQELDTFKSNAKRLGSYIHTHVHTHVHTYNI
jgi:septation ring formation regulator EzrA